MQKVKNKAKIHDAGRERGEMKMRIFECTLSLAGGLISSLSTFFPMCMQYAKLLMMCWCHSVRCIDLEGSSHKLVIGPPSYNLKLHKRLTYMWGPCLTKEGLEFCLHGWKWSSFPMLMPILIFWKAISQAFPKMSLPHPFALWKYLTFCGKFSR